MWALWPYNSQANLCLFYARFWRSSNSTIRSGFLRTWELSLSATFGSFSHRSRFHWEPLPWDSYLTNFPPPWCWMFLPSATYEWFRAQAANISRGDTESASMVLWAPQSLNQDPWLFYKYLKKPSTIPPNLYPMILKYVNKRTAEIYPKP